MSWQTLNDKIAWYLRVQHRLYGSILDYNYIYNEIINGILGLIGTIRYLMHNWVLHMTVQVQVIELSYTRLYRDCRWPGPSGLIEKNILLNNYAVIVDSLGYVDISNENPLLEVNGDITGSRQRIILLHFAQYMNIQRREGILIIFYIIIWSMLK